MKDRRRREIEKLKFMSTYVRIERSQTSKDTKVLETRMIYKLKRT